jgi:hypothetical protein
MGVRTRVAVACRSHIERSTIVKWLEGGGYHAVAIPFATAPFELLIVDAELMTVGSLMHVARYRAVPRPVIVVGDADVEAEVEAERRGASYLVRVDGVASRVIDVSYEGVRLELAAKDRAALPPYFTVRVPLFDVAVLVQRVWMGSATDAAGVLWCGASLARNPQRSEIAWRNLVDRAPVSA